jgi:hypothetical protein
VRTSRWLILSVVVLVIATAGAGITGLILAALALGLPYLTGCVLHPRTIHRGCGGKGYHRSAWYPWSTRKCRGCVGGLQVRHGARAVGLPHIKAEHRARARAVARNRANRTWR